MTDGPASNLTVLRNLATRAIRGRRAARRMGRQSASFAEEVVRSEPGLTDQEREALCLIGGNRAIELARACGESRIEYEDNARCLRERLTEQAARVGLMLASGHAIAKTGPFDIMLVDDDPIVLKVITRMLRQAGHEVLACSGLVGVEAHLYSGVRPDLLITDVALKGSTGKRVAAVVQEKSLKTRVLFISGYGNVAVGGQPVLQKPFKNKELIELIDQVMSASSNTDAHELEEAFALSRKKH